jgi:hypothetical protein
MLAALVSPVIVGNCMETLFMGLESAGMCSPDVPWDRLGRPESTVMLSADET